MGFKLFFAWTADIRAKDDLKLLLLINFITNPFVVSLYWILYNTIHPVLLVFILEAAVVLVKSYYYRRFAQTIVRPFLFALTVNPFSYLCGLIIQLF